MIKWIEAHGYEWFEDNKRWFFKTECSGCVAWKNSTKVKWISLEKYNRIKKVLNNA